MTAVHGKKEDVPEKIIFPPSTILNPVPVVMVSCAGIDPTSKNQRPNIITIAWAGTICSEPPLLSVSIRKSRHSHALISSSGEFVVNLVGESLLKACDYCGVKSGSEEDKFLSCGLTAVPADKMTYAPMIAEAPVSISCSVRQVIELGSHDMFIAEVVSVSVSKDILDPTGKICLENAGLVCYSHGDYNGLGNKLGFFGFSVASRQAYERRMGEKRQIGKPPKKKTT